MSASAGDKCMKKGEAALHSWNLFKSSSSKHEEAKELFEKAAVQYKATGDLLSAAKAYQRAAEMVAHIDAERKDVDLGAALENAAKMFATAGAASDAPPDCLETAKRLYLEAGEAYARAGARNAAACFEAAGDAAADVQEKKECYLRASVCAREKGNKVSATRLLRSVAYCEVQARAFQNAVDLFDQLGREELDDTVTRSGAFRVLFLALLANLAQLGGHQQPPCTETPREILDNLQTRFQEYQQLDTQFTRLCQEHILISALLDALENSDAQAYDAAVARYKRICPLEAPQILMLKEGKGGLNAASMIV